MYDGCSTMGRALTTAMNTASKGTLNAMNSGQLPPQVWCCALNDLRHASLTSVLGLACLQVWNCPQLALAMCCHVYSIEAGISLSALCSPFATGHHLAHQSTRAAIVLQHGQLMTRSWLASAL